MPHLRGLKTGYYEGLKAFYEAFRKSMPFAKLTRPGDTPLPFLGIVAGGRCAR
jgi:hypothetical protein